MAAPESEYDDAYGLPHEQRAMWGAKAEMARQNSALKGINPGATQYTNINSSTAPKASSVAQRASALKRGVAPAQAQSAVQQQPQQQTPIQRESGQPRRGAGAPPGAPTPIYGFNQPVQSPLGKKYSRGYGTSSGLTGESNQFQRNYFGGGNSQFFQALGALPHASPEVQWFAKKAAEEE